MNAADFKKFVSQSQSIRIHLAKGRKINAPSGRYLSVDPTGTRVFFWAADGGFELFDLDEVTSLTAKRRAKKTNKI